MLLISTDPRLLGFPKKNREEHQVHKLWTSLMGHGGNLQEMWRNY